MLQPPVRSNELRRRTCRQLIASAIVAVTLLFGPLPVAAQQMYPAYGTSRLVGTVRDTITGAAILRADVCSEIDTHDNRGARLCVNPDSTGYFELTGLPAERNVIIVSCPGLRGELSRRLLHQDTIVLTEASERRIEVRSNAAGCDMRPFTTRTGTFTGIYSVAFESERFVSCDSSVRAWPRFTSSARAQLQRVSAPPAISIAYFVTLEGTVRGPGQYGHGGVTPYGIDVTRVVRARLATAKDCR